MSQIIPTRVSPSSITRGGKIKYYTAQQVGEFVKDLTSTPLPLIKQRRMNRETGKMETSEYYNIPAAFDIEVSSFLTPAGEKTGIMYIWQLCINGVIIIGRTWREYVDVLAYIQAALNISVHRKLIIYVHNLAYEFQFFRLWFLWSRVFALDERRVVECETIEGIVYKCSYILSGLPLSELHLIMGRFSGIKKAVGDLDYNLTRHSTTPLTSKEMYYCLMDVIVVTCYIQKLIEDEQKITKIPLTKTGYPRRMIREECLQKKKGEAKKNRQKDAYYRLIHKLNLSPELYTMARRAFQGGLTHGNTWNSRKTLYGKIHSRDLSSSYPTVLACEKYPMGSGMDITEDLKRNGQNFDKWREKYGLLLDVGFGRIVRTLENESIIPTSKCRERKKIKEDFGRVVSAEYIRMTITDIDLRTYEQCYDWEYMYIYKAYAFPMDYLPRGFVAVILDLYRRKTELKGIADQKELYNWIKTQLNAIFGVCVTDPIQDKNLYDLVEGVWLDSDEPTEEEMREELEKYNASRNRFLFYLWGVWCTAWARRNLVSAIISLGQDYIYSDTDSVKYFNDSAHCEFFDRYNANIEKKMEMAMAANEFEKDLWKPKDIHGKEHPLGYWEKEPDMIIFKTLGPKRYMYMTEDYKLHLTMAGVNKRITCDYLVDTYGKYGAFKAFAENLTIPGDKTGKKTHTYIDDERRGIVVDYKGTPGTYEERSCIHLEDCEYNLTISDDYSGIEKLLALIFENRKTGVEN